jgi:hypothetical protein
VSYSVLCYLIYFYTTELSNVQIYYLCALQISHALKEVIMIIKIHHTIGKGDLNFCSPHKKEQIMPTEI